MVEDNKMDGDLYIDDDEDTQKDRFFIFKIGSEEYGIEIVHVVEVIGIQKITAIPDMPDYVKGVINLRGQIIPIIDVRKRFGMEVLEYHERTCVLVVDIKGTSIGLVVDEVRDVLHIPQSQIEPPPKVSSKPESRFINGLGKTDDEVKILIDVQKLLYEKDLSKISRVDTPDEDAVVL